MFVLLSFGLLVPRPASAQLDPSASLLIRGGGDETVQPNLDSGRYTVKPSANGRVIKSESVSQSKKTSDLSESQEQLNPNVVSKAANESEQDSNTSTSKKSILDTLRESLLENSEANDAWAKQGQVHPEDSRQNILNISVGPTLMYVDSSSAYWYRNYHSSGPGIDVSVDVWLDSNFGIIGSYKTSLAAEINSEATSQKTTLVDHRFTEIGLASRRYTSESRRSPWFIWSAKYSEYLMVVPKAETQRIRLKTTGVALGIEGYIPTSNTSTWFFGGELLPKLKVTEEATSVAVQSGSNGTSYAVLFQTGQKFSLNRKNQLYWKLSQRLDKSVYRGATTGVDPRTGETPEGVSVTSGMTIFGFGFTWGD